ncbi:MAG TPA: DUF748 domain-containing protein [Rubrivivax sp.]
MKAIAIGGMRALRVVAWVVAGIAVTLALAWLAVPSIAKSQIESRVSALLGREVRVAKVEFSPIALSLTLRGVTVAAAPGSAASAPQFEAARLYVDANLRSLLRLAPVIDAAEIDAPKLRLARIGEGRYDIDDILARLKPSQPEPPAAEPQRFALFNLQLRDGEVDFDDSPMQRRHALRALQLALPFLSNLPDDMAVKVEPRLAFVIEGSAVDLRGRSVPFAPDRETQLDIQLDDLPLARWWTYVPVQLPLRPEGGVLALDLKLQFAQPQGQVPRVVLTGQSSLRDLGFRNQRGEPMLGFKRLTMQLDDVRPLERKIALGPVRLEGLEAEVRREASGQLEWATLMLPAGNPSAPAAASTAASASASATAAASGPQPAPATPAGPWQLSAGRTELAGARVRWRDATLQPAAELTLEAVDLLLERVRWPSDGEAPVTGSLRLRAGMHEVAQLKVQGEASDKRARLTVEADAVQLSAAAPYLRSVLRPALEGRAKFAAGLEWAAGDTPRLALALDSLQVDGLRLFEGAAAKAMLPARDPAVKPGSIKRVAGRGGARPGVGKPARKATPTAPRPQPGTLASIASLRIEDSSVDLLARHVSVGTVRVRQPAVKLQRLADGSLDAVQWVVARPPAESGAPPATPWHVDLKDLLLEGGQVDWLDAAARPAAPVDLKLRGLRLAAQGAAWPAGAAPLRVHLSSQIQAAASGMDSTPALPGRIDLRGQVVAAPFAARGTLALERLPLLGVEPYIAAFSPVLLKRGELGVKGEFDFKLGTSAAGGPTLNARGDVLLADLQVFSRPLDPAAQDSEELLTWQSLTLKPVRVALAPGVKPRLEIDEIQLSDFFARLTITEQGRFNLTDVQPRPAPGAPVAPPGFPMGGPVAAAAAPPASVAPERVDGRLQNLPIDLVVGATKLVNGRVDFTDRFIRPNYQAALSELNGSIGRVATGTRDMAVVDLRGRVAGTGLLEIRGAVNPTASPLALDIQARTTDIELAPFSPYAGKYAGYGIERGKLSLDVSYRIDADGKLDAKNQLTLNQLTFGPATDSPDATKLPVRLAVALLTDRNGVIDINLPITGSINEPKFSIWGLVWQVLGNLITKAVTAPFSAIAGGGGEDLSQIEFVPGTRQIAPSSSAAIDRVAKAFADRPALRMTVVGTADPVSEREAIQAASLDARVQAVAQRERARAGVAAPAASAPPLSAEERTRIVKRIYSDTKLPDKPRNFIGMAKDIPLAEMEAMLKSATVVSADTARELSLQRGLAVRDALIAKGLPSERLFLGEPKLRGAGEGDAAWTPRVQLALAAP